MKVPNDLDENNHGYEVYFLDWGMEYLTNVEDINKMPKDFIYLPATAHKCYVKGALYIKISLYTLPIDLKINIVAMLILYLNCRLFLKLIL